MVYVPGFSPALMAEERGGPARVALPLGGAQVASAPVAINPLDQVLARGDQAELQLARMPNDFRVTPHASGFASGIVNSALAAAQPASATASQPAGLTFLTDRGRQAGYGKGSSGFVAFDPNAQYRLWDERGKNRIVASGTGEAGLRSIHETANQLNSAGKKANWGVERFDPATGRWVRILENDPAKNIVGKIADIALPVAGAILLPGVGGALGGALGAGLGAAGGSALSSVAQGRSLTDTLLRAGLSGVAAGGLSAIGGAPFIPASSPSGAVGGAVAGGVAGANQMALAGLQAAGLQSLATPGITVLGNAAGAALGSGLGAGAVGAGLGSGAAGALSGLGGGGGTQPQQQGPYRNEQGDLVLTGTQTPPPNTTPGAIGGGLLPSGGVLPTTGGGMTNTLEGGNTPEEGGGMDLDDIIRYLRAGSLGVGLIGSLFGGGGGGQGNNRIPAGLGNGQLNPVFGGNLPAPTIPGASDNFAQRQTNQDWYRYGYGPAQSFFNYVPQGQPNTGTAYTGYAEGGLTMGDDVPRDAFAVEGPGTGRSDEIPALLSDGEYVIDAETVALLGDGSTKAGADRLDQFRVNVRKHKGQQLAKGQFSPNAKPPERYMHGGLT